MYRFRPRPASAQSARSGFHSPSTRPVIGCYNTGGIPEALIDGTTGLLVPLGDSVRLAAAIKSLLQSPIKRLSMGTEGRRFVSEHFSISALISRHEQFCGDVMQARTQPAPCSTA